MSKKTCIDTVITLLANESPSTSHKVRSLLDNAFNCYNSILSIKDRDVAIFLMQVAYEKNKTKIHEYCAHNECLLTHTLNAHYAYYRKYFTSISFYFYKNSDGLFVWSEPKSGDIMVTTRKISIPEVAIPTNKKVTLIEYKHKGHGNVLEAKIKTKENYIINCNFGDIRQLNKPSRKN